MQKIFTFLFLLLSFFANAQHDSLSKYTTEELIEKAGIYIYTDKLIYCDELLKRNPADSIKFKIYYLMGSYEREVTGDLQKALTFSKKALTFKTTNFNTQIALINLGELYALTNNYAKALELIEEIKKNRQQNFTTKYDGIYYLMGDFKKSIAICLKYVKDYEKYIASHPIENSDKKATKYAAYASLATYYNYLHKLDSASYYTNKLKFEDSDFYDNYFDGLWYAETFTLILKGQYDKAIARMDKSKDFIHSSDTELYNANYYYAVCYQKKNDYKKSLEYAESGLKNILVLNSFQNYELELYKIASENAQKLGLTEKENYYLKKYSEGAQKINYQEKAAFMAKLYDQDVVKPLTEELILKDKNSYYLWSGLVLVLFLSGNYVVYSIYKSKRYKKHFDAVIARLEENYQNPNLVEVTEPELSNEISEIEEKQPSKNTITISEETEQKILKKLENFERKMQFLSPDVSLGKIAQDFKTNAYYITYVIKFHKNTNFNGYINKLRIDYITHKLKYNSEYTNYKIEYLTQESGFSSYSTFKRIFTKETGIDPSKFIEYLKKAKELQKN